MDTPVVPRVRRRLPIVVGALALALAGLYVASAATHGPSRAPPPQWLASNTTTHTITLTLIAAYSNALSGFNFNGYGHGKMVIRTLLEITYSSQSACAKLEGWTRKRSSHRYASGICWPPGRWTSG